MRNVNAQANARHGFTLIELLVVISIIAVLVAILLPVLSSTREAARRVACAANMQQQHIAVLTYASDYEGQLPPVWLYPGPAGVDIIGFNHWTRWGHRASSNPGDGPWQNMGRLIPGGHMSEPSAFFCPSQPHVDYTFDNYNTPWPTPKVQSGVPGSTPGIRFSYNFNPRVSEGVAGASLAQLTRRYQRVADLVSDDVFIMDLVESPTSIAHRAAGGFNVGRGDGSVSFASAPSVINLVDTNPLIPQQDYLAWDLHVLDALRKP